MFADEAEQLAAENTDDSNHGEKGGAPLREQDRFLPIANVAKIMKRAIPDTGKVNNKVQLAIVCMVPIAKYPLYGKQAAFRVLRLNWQKNFYNY